MHDYRIKWVNTGRIETIRGYDLKNAFNNAGLLMYYNSDKYILV